MSVIGIAANGDQIVDGIDSSIKETVTPGTAGNAAQNYNQAFDQQTGRVEPQASFAGGRMVLSDTDKWTLILAEMRLQTFLLMEIAAGRLVGDELDALRADTADPALLNTLS